MQFTHFVSVAFLRPSSSMFHTHSLLSLIQHCIGSPHEHLFFICPVITSRCPKVQQTYGVYSGYTLPQLKLRVSFYHFLQQTTISHVSPTDNTHCLFQCCFRLAVTISLPPLACYEFSKLLLFLMSPHQSFSWPSD
jgi:hypothetical protein